MTPSLVTAVTDARARVVCASIPAVQFHGYRARRWRPSHLNEKPDQCLAQGAAENNKANSPFYGIFSSSSNLGSSNTVSQRQFWLAYPQFTSVNQDGSNNTVYHAVQLSLEKRSACGKNSGAN